MLLSGLETELTMALVLLLGTSNPMKEEATVLGYHWTFGKWLKEDRF